MLEIHGALNYGLTPVPEGAAPRFLLDYLVPGSTQALEGTPAQWAGQSLDLDFLSMGQRVLHTRGWVQPQGDGWLVQLIDISDLQHSSQQARTRGQYNQLLSS